MKNLGKGTALKIIEALENDDELIVACVLAGGLSRNEAIEIERRGAREYHAGRKTWHAKVFLAAEQSEMRRVKQAVNAVTEIIALGEDSPVSALKGALELLERRQESRWGKLLDMRIQGGVESVLDRCLPRMSLSARRELLDAVAVEIGLEIDDG